jgi:hypothetical protein
MTAGDFQRFWGARGGPAAFEAWRVGRAPIPQLLVRVVAPTFVAAFVIDDEVRECAPILRRYLAGKTEVEARAVVAARGWRASIVR